MDKKSLSERDICTKFITPAIVKAGWDKNLQIREEVSFTAGKIIVRGKLVSRSKQKRADYILYYKNNIPIAVVEAKDNNHTVGAGMQQAIDYAETLDIPFVFTSNGDAFLFHDGTHDSPKYQLNGYPFVTSKNLNNGKLDFSNIQYISEEDFKKFSERSYVDNEDILFAMIGSIGNPVIVKKDREFSIKNVALFKKSKFISVKYLYYYLLHIQEILKSNASGAVQSFVSLSTLRTYLFALPPLTEQQRIVEKLEEILPLVEDYGKNEEILSEMNKKLPKQIRQSILQYAVQGKLVPQNPNDEPASKLLKRIKAEKEQLIKDGKIKKEKSLAPISEEEIPYELPQGWEFVRLGDIVNYGSTGSVEYSKSLDENMWILDLEDIEKESSRLLVKNRIKTKTFNSTKKLFNKGDGCFCK